MGQPHDMPRPERASRNRTGPIFTDPSGQRRRLMRVLGAAGSVLLVGALILVGIGLFGGPDTPFSVFGAPIAGHGNPGKAGHGAPGHHAPGSGGGAPPGPHASSTRSASPSPSGSATPSSPAGSPSTSPSPTNKAGKTPPGQGRTRSPHPHPSPSSHGP